MKGDELRRLVFVGPHLTELDWPPAGLTPHARQT